MYVYLDSV